MAGACSLPQRGHRHAGSAGDFRETADAPIRKDVTSQPDSAPDDMVFCSRNTHVGAFSKARGTRTRHPMGTPGPSPRLPQHAHGNGICDGRNPFLCRAALHRLGRARLCVHHCLEPLVPRSLSDLEIVGCKSAAAVHFSPSFCPIAGLWGCKSGKNCPRWGQFSLSTFQVRQPPRFALPIGCAGGGTDRISLYGDCRTIFTSSA